MDMKWDAGLSEIVKLCGEYPDLNEKYYIMNQEAIKLKEITRGLKEFKFYEKMFGSKRYKKYVERVIEQEQIYIQATEDYQFLLKLVKDY